MITVGIYSKREPIFVFVSAEEPCPESASQDLEPSLRERKKKKKKKKDSVQLLYNRQLPSFYNIN